MLGDPGRAMINPEEERRYTTQRRVRMADVLHNTSEIEEQLVFRNPNRSHTYPVSRENSAGTDMSGLSREMKRPLLNADQRSLSEPLFSMALPRIGGIFTPGGSLRVNSRLIPRFTDELVEEEYTAARNASLVVSLRRLGWLLPAAGALSTALHRLESERQHIYVDVVLLSCWPVLWLFVACFAAVVRRWPGRTPHHIDLWFMALCVVPTLAVLGLSPARAAHLLGVEVAPSQGGEATCICQLSIALAAVAHFVRISVLAKLLTAHLAVGIYLAAATWYSSEITPWSAAGLAGLLYMQAIVTFSGARIADQDKRQKWLLRNAAVTEVNHLQKTSEEVTETATNTDYKSVHSEAFTPRSVQEDAVSTLERLSQSLARLADHSAIEDEHMKELLQLCADQVNGCLSTIRRSAADRVGRQWRRGFPRSLHNALEQFMESEPSLTSFGLSAPHPRLHELFAPFSSPSKSFNLDKSLSTVDLADDDSTNACFSTPDGESGELGMIARSAGNDWDLDVLGFDQRTGGRSFCILGMRLLASPIDAGLVKRQEIAEFLKELVSIYKPLPYHNAIHGADVANGFMSLLNMSPRLRDTPLGPPECSLSSELNVAACMIAALGHDVGHPGYNNSFLASTLAPLAVTYNDMSILESFHAAVTFTVLLRPNVRFFARLEDKQFADFRKFVVNLILVTDMKTHLDDVASFRLRLTDKSFGLAEDYDPGSRSRSRSRSSFAQTPNPPTATPDDIRQVQLILMKAADLGHTAKPWSLHQEWTTRITEEFHNQGDEERARGLPVSQITDRNGFNLAKSQIGFLQYVAMPLWNEVAHLDQPQHAGEGFEEVRDACLQNLEHWQEQADAS